MIPYPPQFNEDIEPFSDALEIIIPDKIRLMLGYMQRLEDKKNLWLSALEILRRIEELDDSTLYFWNLWIEIEFIPYQICRKWLFYYFSLYEKLPQKPRIIFDRFKDEMDLEVKKNTPIENFYEGNLRVNGSRLLGLCPFHKENSPSFFIFTNTNTFNCFGCGKNGDVISFIQETKNVDFKEALRYL